jgi:hypothetical protein
MALANTENGWLGSGDRCKNQEFRTNEGALISLRNFGA